MVHDATSPPASPATMPFQMFPLSSRIIRIPSFPLVMKNDPCNLIATQFYQSFEGRDDRRCTSLIRDGYSLRHSTPKMYLLAYATTSRCFLSCCRFRKPVESREIK